MCEENQQYWHKIEHKTKNARVRDAQTQEREMIRYVLDGDVAEKVIVADTWMIRLAPFVGGMILLCGIFLFFTGHWLMGIGALVLCGVDFLFVYDRIRHRARTAKYSIVHQAIEPYFKPEIYLAYKRLSDDVIREADICDEWDSALMSDYFLGSWKGIPFEFGDLTLKGKEVGSNTVQTLFMGQLYIIETGLNLTTPISIRERLEPLSQEVYEGRKNSERFFLTGNVQFDRQFDVRLGSSRCVNGFEDGMEGRSPAELRKEAHALVDELAADIIEADEYAVSRTSMRFTGNRLYLAVENTRDSFEFKRGDEKNIAMMKQRFDEEIKDMTLYLDLITRGLDRIKKKEPQAASDEQEETQAASDEQKETQA